MVRLYIMPAEYSGTVRGIRQRGIKYIQNYVSGEGLNPDALIKNPIGPWGGIPFGATDIYLAAINLSDKDHELLVSQPDVVGVPVDFDSFVSIEDAEELKSMGFPIEAGKVWRSILRQIAQMCLMAQRHNGMAGYVGLNPAIICEGRSDETKFSLLSRREQLALLLAAEVHDIDSSILDSNETTIGDLLRAAGSKEERMTLNADTVNAISF